MTVLNRLKLELNNQEYFSDEGYIQLLTENNLSPEAEYIKSKMQKNLLFTVLDVLESVANDVDIMSTMMTSEFQTIGQAYQYIEMRIAQIKDKIAAIPNENEEYNCFSLMYTRNAIAPVNRRNVVGLQGVESLTREEIDSFLNDNGGE